MKKTICLMFILFIFSSFALAESEADYSQYTIEELVHMRILIENEINSRVNTATATLQPGNYVIGIDIREGSYVLIGLLDKDPDGNTSQALYAESIKKAQSWDYIDSNYLDQDENWRITLQDGMVLEIRNSDCAIQQAPPLLFAPESNSSD